MADERPSTEVAWRLAEVQRLLGELVRRDEYQARLEAAERRFADLAAAMDRLDRKHDGDVHELHQRIEEHERTSREGGWHWQQIVIPSAVALIIALVGTLTELWIAGIHK